VTVPVPFQLREREKVGFRIEAVVVRSEEPHLARPPGSLVPFVEADNRKASSRGQGTGTGRLLLR